MVIGSCISIGTFWYRAWMDEHELDVEGMKYLKMVGLGKYKRR